MKRLLIIRRFNRRQAIIASTILAAVLAGGVGGYMIAGGSASEQSASSDGAGRKILYWYDPMIPQERYPGPGKSSMNMDLIPKYADEGGQSGIRVSPAVMQNLGIRLAKVEVRDLAPVVSAVGTVQFDERLISEVQTLTPGFVESLSVRAEGEPIAAGRIVSRVYSPELLAAQNEYKALLSTNSAAGSSLRAAARSRLQLLGLPNAAIARLERGGAPQRTYPVVAGRSGVVTKIGARPGGQVALGESIVTIQGLSRVLVIADVPEASLGNVRAGQPAEISFPAYGGETRSGVVDYIFPALNERTRTAQVRITLANPGGRLRQGMFASVTLQGTGGMATVVPSEALIDTGRRKTVIVKRDGRFIPQEVKIGRDYQDYTQILAGLKPGETVVASGQFLIDSEASLSGVISRLQSAPAAAPKLATSSGIITSIDAAKGLVTIDHRPIPELGWPAMAMTFKLGQPSMARGLRKDLEVQFAVRVEPGNGRPVIDRIGPGPRR